MNLFCFRWYWATEIYCACMRMLVLFAIIRPQIIFFLLLLLKLNCVRKHWFTATYFLINRHRVWVWERKNVAMTMDIAKNEREKLMEKLHEINISAHCTLLWAAVMLLMTTSTATIFLIETYTKYRSFFSLFFVILFLSLILKLSFL